MTGSDSRPVHSTQTPVPEKDRDLYEGPRVTSDNIPILEVQRGQAPAPNPASGHKLVDFKYLQMLLLNDKKGTIRYRCARFVDGESGPRCWRDDFDNPRSAVAHINSHGQVRTPDYSDRVLRMLVRMMKAYQQAGHRNYAMLTADELNRDGVQTVNGQPWNSTQVSGLYLTYKDRWPVRVSQEMIDARRAGLPKLRSAVPVSPAAPAVSPAALVTSATTTTRPQEPRVATTPAPADPPVKPVPVELTLAEMNHLASQILRETDKLFDMVKDHATNVVSFVEIMGAKMAALAQEKNVDPKVLSDAAKWQRYLELIGKNEDA